MAQRVSIVLEDDIDGSVADETVTFALDGVTLRDRPQRQERRRAARCAWRPTSATHAAPPGAAPPAAGCCARVRQARPRRRPRVGALNGHKVSDRGRISAEVQAAYDKAH